jgi:excisionase family DNA binding protein
VTAAANLAPLLSEEQAAALLGVSDRTLRKERQAGRLPYIMIRRVIRYSAADLNDYIERAALSLYRRDGSPFWQYDFAVNGQRFRGSTGETGKREALKVEDDHKQAARKRGQRRKEWTVDMLCAAYWDEHAQHRPSHSTILGQLAALRRHLGKDRKLSSITNAALMDYRAKRRGDGLAQHSINREVTILRAAMRHVARSTASIPKLHWDKLKSEEPAPAPALSHIRGMGRRCLKRRTRRSSPS